MRKSRSKDKGAAQSRKWRKEHPEYYTAYLKEYSRNWRQNHIATGLCTRCNNPAEQGKKTCLECQLRNKQGGPSTGTMRYIREEDHPAVLLALKTENKSCACCGATTHNGKGWHIDHDHVTKQFRGLLCQNCNMGLGQFKDSEGLLLKAIEYLRKARLCQ
jgi:hypothetical protein